MTSKDFLKQQLGYSDRDIEYNPTITLKTALSFMTAFGNAIQQGQKLPIDSVSGSSYCNCENHSKWREQGRCCECGKQI